MHLFSFLRKLPPLLLIIFYLSACVDNGYDLSDLDTDRLVAGDRWTLPLGTAVVAASEILDVDNVEEISTDAEGNYIARYRDVIHVTPQTVPSFRDQSFGFPAVIADIPAAPNEGGNYMVPIPETTGVMNVKGSDEIIQLYSAELHTGSNESLFTITLDIEGDQPDGYNADLKITLPEGYVVDEDHLSTGVTVAGGVVNWSFPMNGSAAYSASFPVSRIDLTGDRTTRISGNISAPGGVTGGISPKFTFRAGLSNIRYKVIYGEFEIEFESSPESANIGGLYDIFEGENTVLSLRDPHIIINSESNVGMAVDAGLSIYADNGSTTKIDVENILIPAAETFGAISRASFWIGEYEPASPGYIFKYAPGLNSVIRDSHEFVYLAGNGVSVESDEAMFYPENAACELEYTVEIPLAPAKDFYAVSEQVIEDAFDDDVIEYLFTGGTAEIYGTATNAIPLEFLLYLVVTDSAGESVGISLPYQVIEGPVSPAEPSVSSIKFLFDEAALAKMTNARNLVLRFDANGTDDAPVLNVDHELVLKLKIRKSGGIVISSDDDE